MKADLYTFEDVIPDMFSNLINITADSDIELQTSNNANLGMWGEVVKNKIGSKDEDNNNMIVMVDRVYNP